MKKKDFDKLYEKVNKINSNINLINGSDEDNAIFLVKMLDIVEKDGWMVDLRTALDHGDSGVYLRMPGVYEAWVCYNQDKMDILFKQNYSYPHQENFGKTRWEAVAKAFVSIYNLKPSLKPYNS